MKYQSSYVLLLFNILITVMILGTILSGRTIFLFDIKTTGGILCIPFAYSIIGILAEVYGYGTARRAIWIGVLCILITIPIIYIATILPSPYLFSNHSEFIFTFRNYPRLAYSAVIGFLISEFSTAFMISKAKHQMDGEMTLLRLALAPLFGQEIAVIVFYCIFIIPFNPLSIWLPLILGRLVLGLIFHALLVFPMYIISTALKKYDYESLKDARINFNPFKI